jgi:hypothetical protein
MTREDRTETRGQGAGWRAFLLGMIGMFAVIALWVALVEPAEAPEDEVRLIGRAEASDVRKEPPTSDYR